MARFASIAAITLLLVAAASAHLSVNFNAANKAQTKMNLAEPTHQPEPTHHGGDPDAPRKIYELTLRFIEAVTWRDFKALDMILDPLMVARITDVGCGFWGKADFVDLIQNDFVASETVTIRGWVESARMGIFSADVIGIRNTSSTPANKTFHAPHVYFSIVPSEDFMRVMVYEQFTDRAFAQSNTTAMIGVFTKLVNASMNKDITTWTNALTSDFKLAIWLPWVEEFPMAVNKTETLKFMADTFAHQTKAFFAPVQIFAACDLVLAEFDHAEMRDDGRAMTNHFYYSMVLTPQMQVSMINEFPTKLF